MKAAFVAFLLSLLANADVARTGKDVDEEIYKAADSGRIHGQVIVSIYQEATECGMLV